MRYTEGILDNDTVILDNGIPLSISDILTKLNQLEEIKQKENSNSKFVISEERFEEIMEDNRVNYEGDNALQGLNIIQKYVDSDKKVIKGASHTVIFSLDIKVLIEKGIIEEDVKKLRQLDWVIQDGYLAIYL